MEQKPAAGGPKLALGSLTARSWDIYKRIVLKSAIAFGVVFLMLMPLPPIVFIESPAFVLVPISILLQLVIPAAAGSVAVMIVGVTAAAELAGTQATIADGLQKLRGNAKAVLGAMGLAALITTFVALVMGIYASLILHLFMGPPLIAQAVAVEGRPLREAWEHVKTITRTRLGRVLLYLLNVALVVGIAELLLVGGLTSSVAGAPDAVRIAVFLLAQSVLLGAIAAFMAVFETVLYFDLSSPIEATATPD